MGTVHTHRDSIKVISERTPCFHSINRPFFGTPTTYNNPKCVSASLSTLARPVYRSVMPVGNSTVWSTASSLMVRCPVTRPLAVVTTLSTPSSVRLELASTCHVPSSSIWSQQSSMRSGLEPTANCSIQNSGSLARKMLPTTMPVVTTPLERRLSTWSWTASVSWLISALVYRASSSSTALAVALDLVSPLCSWSAFP